MQNGTGKGNEDEPKAILLHELGKSILIFSAPPKMHLYVILNGLIFIFIVYLTKTL